MKENFNSSPAENFGPKSAEAPLTPEELATLEKKYAVGAPANEQGPDTSEGGVTELEPDPGTGHRRVEIGGQAYLVMATDSGKVVEMIPYSLDESGNTEYGEPMKSESLFAKVDPEIAKRYEERLNNFTAENYDSLDKEGREQLINNFFSGSEEEIGARISRLNSSDDKYSSFGQRIWPKVGYNKGQYQVGHGWN